MLYIGEYDTLPIGQNRYMYPGNENINIVNLSSFIEGYPRLALMPNMELFSHIDDTEYNFDIQYAKFILENDLQFSSLYLDIINPLALGYSVYILIQRGNPFAEITAESLMKFIQQRYGYNYYIINDFGDLEGIIPNGRFHINGLYNLDLDRTRMDQLAEKYRDLSILGIVDEQ